MKYMLQGPVSILQYVLADNKIEANDLFFHTNNYFVNLALMK